MSLAESPRSYSTPISPNLISPCRREGFGRSVQIWKARLSVGSPRFFGAPRGVLLGHGRGMTTAGCCTIGPDVSVPVLLLQIDPGFLRCDQSGLGGARLYRLSNPPPLPFLAPNFCCLASLSIWADRDDYAPRKQFVSRRLETAGGLRPSRCAVGVLYGWCDESDLAIA